MLPYADVYTPPLRPRRHELFRILLYMCPHTILLCVRIPIYDICVRIPYYHMHVLIPLAAAVQS
jgi:hypothetical protein